MAQMTIRVPDELLERVRRAAEDTDQSMNEYVATTLRARVDPDLAGTEVDRIRERLAHADLLAEGGPSHARHPDPDALARARAAAGRGTSGSDLVSEGRE